MSKELNAFSDEVIKSLRSYVYMLMDPRDGKVFYIGKGKGNRIFQHVNNLLKNEDLDDYDFSVDLKSKKIQEIHEAGLEVKHIIHRHGLTDDVAFHVEAALIDAFPEVLNLQIGRAHV